MKIHLYVVLLSLVNFIIFSLVLIFVDLIAMSLSMFPFGFFLPGTLCFLDLGLCFLSCVREVFSCHLFRYFLRSFLSLFSFWPCHTENSGAFNVVPEVSETVLISFHSFFFVLFLCSYFHHSVLQLTFSFFCLSYSVIYSFCYCC